MKMCGNCRALNIVGRSTFRCDLGYTITSVYCDSIVGRVTRPMPAIGHKCPKPLSYKAYFAAKDKLKDTDL